MAKKAGHAKAGPHTAKQIREVTLGDLLPLRGRIILEDYDRAWPRIFGAEAEHIRRVLQERALTVEHVGSTAVPD